LLRRDRIGFVFQAFNLVPTLSARDNMGQTRAQARGMIRWESVIIAVFGTVGGMILGTFLGWAVVRSSGGASLAVFAAPPLQLILFLVLGAVTGILAGIRPARRAARLNMISAITTARARA
jgi:putative ABC transport system permease protein